MCQSFVVRDSNRCAMHQDRALPGAIAGPPPLRVARCEIVGAKGVRCFGAAVGETKRCQMHLPARRRQRTPMPPTVRVRMAALEARVAELERLLAAVLGKRRVPASRSAAASADA